MSITYADIANRCRMRDYKTEKSVTHIRLYTESNVFCVNNAIEAIKKWDTLAETTNEAFNRALDAFEEVCLNENVSTINSCGRMLAENVQKVRDASQLINSLKNRFGRLRKKVATSINKKYQPVNNAITSSLGKMHQTINMGVASNNNQSSNGSSGNSAAKDDAIKEAFDNLISQAALCAECDRINETYSKIIRRFNLDRMVSNVMTETDIHQAVMEITSCIDTYNTKFKNKYSAALENSFYVLNKHRMNYPSEKIIEAVTDYFIFCSYLTESDIQDIKSVRDISVVFEAKDFDLVSYLYDDPNEDSIFDMNGDGELSEDDIAAMIESYVLEGDIGNSIKKGANDIKTAAKGLKAAAKTGNPEERDHDEVKKQLEEFRKSCAKDKDNKNNIVRFKALVTGIFTKNPEQIVEELPNILGVIRYAFVIGGMYVNPVIGIMAFIIDKIIKMTLSRKQCEKIIKAYQKEIDSVNSKLDKAKDEKTKDYLKKYLDELKKDYSKIKEYENNLYSDEENDERDTNTDYGTRYDFEDDDFGFDDWDDFDLEEAASVVYMADMLENISENLIDDNGIVCTDIDGIISSNITKLDNDTIDAITDFSITVPVILEKNKLCESLTAYRNELRKENSINYMRIDCLNENIAKLKNDTNVYALRSDTASMRCYLACVNEFAAMNTNQYITEMNFTNTLRLAVDRLKKAAINLGDKEKQMSNSIDVSVNNISRGIEDAIKNDNREAIIKGRILPSASKCIKLALTLGVTWAISPAVSVVTAIGYFACSAKLRAKERQLVLDDIDIELKMVDRYIKQAEEKGDLKKVRQYEIIQRNLQRQQQRIKYKMKIVYNQNVPNVVNDD